MAYSPPPPPLPPQRKTSVLPYLFAALGFILMIAIATAGVTAYYRIKKRNAERLVAMDQMEKELAATRDDVVDRLQKGETPGSKEYMGRMKDTLEKSAEKMSGSDAAAARGLASFMTHMQEHAQAYEAATDRMTEAKVFGFRITERATIAEHRKLVTEFAAANERLADKVRHAEELVRAELVAAKVPERMMTVTMNGFNRSRPQRELQLRIRDYDRVLGETSLATLDLLDKNWGQWSVNETSGTLVFQNDALLASYNQLITKIQTTADEQIKLQQELAEKMRTLGN